MIYVSHSTAFDYQKELYEPLVALRDRAEFVFPHENGSEQYHARDLFFDKKCSLVLAEVSFPSTGQGIELGWADANNIKIVCLYKKDASYSGALKIICKDFIEYESAEDLAEEIKKII